MLAQGQSSSAKRGGLAVVSSGLIFLKKKKKKVNFSLPTYNPFAKERLKELQICSLQMGKLNSAVSKKSINIYKVFV